MPVTEDQIKYMVSRFLGWRLPEPWHPDNGVSYVRPNYAHGPADHDWPTGTNLFDATQAEAMIRYMLEGMAAHPLYRMRERINVRLNNHLCDMKEGFDDSIVGFNEAWTIVATAFAEVLGEE